jgi:hypothetical protein
MPVGRFSKDAGNACEFLAIPEPSGQHLNIYGPSDSAGGTFERLSSVSTSDLGYQRAFFADVNNDGHYDLLLSGGEFNQVSYGVGDGTFHSDGSQIPPAFSGKADNQLSSYDSAGPILAAGALPDQAPVLLNYGDYTDARVASLTLDQRLDAIAINSSTGRVDVLRSLPNGLLNPLRLPAANLSSIEDIGDFDGDGLSDVLFSAKSDPNAPASTISLLFSPVTNGSSARPLAFPGPVHELAAGYVVDAIGGADTNADIGALYQGNDGSLRLGFLLGGSDQLLRSRIGADKTNEFTALREPALGHFIDPSQLELAVANVVVNLEREEQSRLRLDLFSVDAQGSTLLDQTPLDLNWDANPNINFEAIDQDGDGLDELYLNSGGELKVLRRAGNHFEAKRADREAWQVLTREDANGDTRPDLATKTQDGRGSAGVRVLLGASPDGTAGASHDFQVDSVLCPFIAGQAFIQADDDAERELMVLCSDNEDVVGISSFDSAGGLAPSEGTLLLFDVDWTSDALSLRGFPESASSTSSLAVGDFNGDGVEDVATGGEQPQLWLGEPRQ